MRAYRIERSTMEWGHILKQIENGNKPIYKNEQERGYTVLDVFVANVGQALEHDDHGTPLPERMSNSDDPVVPWQQQRADEAALQKAHEIIGALVEGANFRNFPPLLEARELIGNALAADDKENA